MRRRACVAIAALAMAFLVAGCSNSTSSPSGVTYAVYRFTCCTSADIEQPWRPGKTVQLHWIVELAGQTSSSEPDQIALVAVLEGPYPDAATLKSGVAASRNLPAATTFTDDRSAVLPISNFELPADLPRGLYNLTLAVESARGNGTRSASVVSIGP